MSVETRGTDSLIQKPDIIGGVEATKGKTISCRALRYGKIHLFYFLR